MYFVNRDKIGETLKHLDELLNLFEKEDNWLKDDISKLALQRIGINVMEAMMDVGNLMIDGFIMRDPGSYEDIVDILLDERVITEDMEMPIKKVVGLKKMLFREYIQVDNEALYDILKSNLQAIKKFSPSILKYLENELGPVSAFTPENKQWKNIKPIALI